MEAYRPGDDELSEAMEQAVANEDLEALEKLEADHGLRFSWDAAAVNAFADLNGDFYHQLKRRHDEAVAAGRVTPDEKLEAAVEAEDEAAVLELLESGDVGADDLLLTAADKGKVGLVDLALDKGADIHCTSRHCDETPLLTAAGHGKKKLLARLLDAGADPNARNKWEMTAFLMAVSNNTPAMIKFLAERGGDPDTVDEEGLTCLTLAIQHKRVGAVKALIESGADVHRKDGYKWTPWMASQQLPTKTREKIQKILREAGGAPPDEGGS